jgi:hypothetical protein
MEKMMESESRVIFSCLFISSNTGVVSVYILLVNENWFPKEQKPQILSQKTRVGLSSSLIILNSVLGSSSKIVQLRNEVAGILRRRKLKLYTNQWRYAVDQGGVSIKTANDPSFAVNSEKNSDRITKDCSSDRFCFNLLIALSSFFLSLKSALYVWRRPKMHCH